MSRLTAERLAELYSGTLRLVAEHGFDNVTMDQIADTTHSSKATLYRQWGNKVGLVVEALRCSVPMDHPVADTGSLRDDLHEVLLNRRGTAEEADLVASILHAIKSNAELAKAVREQIVATGRERVQVILQRAVDRGEVAPDCPALPHIDLVLFAPIVLNEVVNGQPASDDLMRDYVDSVLLPALGIH